jgi:hypothetical protein
MSAQDALALLLTKKPSKSASSSSAITGDNTDDHEDLTAAAQEVLDAIDSKNAGALASALHAFYELCDNDIETQG